MHQCDVLYTANKQEGTSFKTFLLYLIAFALPDNTEPKTALPPINAIARANDNVTTEKENNKGHARAMF